MRFHIRNLLWLVFGCAALFTVVTFVMFHVLPTTGKPSDYLLIGMAAVVITVLGALSVLMNISFRLSDLFLLPPEDDSRPSPPKRK